MIFEKKTWQDRLTEFPGRRNITDVATGVRTVVEVERNEGEDLKEGDRINSANMNGLEQRIETGFNVVTGTPEGQEFEPAVSSNEALRISLNEAFLKINHLQTIIEQITTGETAIFQQEFDLISSENRTNISYNGTGNFGENGSIGIRLWFWAHGGEQSESERLKTGIMYVGPFMIAGDMTSLEFNLSTGYSADAPSDSWGNVALGYIDVNGEKVRLFSQNNSSGGITSSATIPSGTIFKIYMEVSARTQGYNNDITQTAYVTKLLLHNVKKY